MGRKKLLIEKKIRVLTMLLNGILIATNLKADSTFTICIQTLCR